MIRVAALQAPYSSQHNIDDAIAIIRESIVRCEEASVDILCCPEAFLGGLADHADPRAIDAESGALEQVLSPLANKSVAIIVGFTERAAEAKLYNTAAVYFGGKVIGIYRKLRPAIRHSVYNAGEELPVFEIKGLKFGIQICNDSNFPEQAAKLAADGARVIFIPSNTALPHARADIAGLTANVDRSLALLNSVYVVRADVTGILGGFTAYGTSKIVDSTGSILAEAVTFEPTLIHALVANVRQAEAGDA